MKKFTLFAVLAVFCGASVLLAEGEQRLPKPAICVGNVLNKSGQNVSIETFVTRLNTAIVNTRQFDVIESERIDEIVAEWNKANAGLTNGSTDPETQKIAEVGYKLIATLTSFEIKSTAAKVGGATMARHVANLTLSVRFLRLSDGKIVADKEVVGTSTLQGAATSGSVQRTAGDKFYQDCVKDAAQKVVDALMDLCYPIETMMAEDEDEVVIKVQSERVKEGDHFKVYRVTEDGVEMEVAVIKITVVRPMQSTAEVVSRKGKRKIKKGYICRPTKAPVKKRRATAFDDL